MTRWWIASKTPDRLKPDLLPASLEISVKRACMLGVVVDLDINLNSLVRSRHSASGNEMTAREIREDYLIRRR